MNASCSKVVILAGGLGKRMRAADDSVALPAEQASAADTGVKAMIPVGRPFLDYVLSGLADAGFTDVCIVVAPGRSVIREYYENRVRPTRLRISFTVQLSALGSADAVIAAEEFTAGEPFVVINSDNYYPSEVLALLRAADRAATVGFSREALIRGGDIPADRISAYAVLDIGPDDTLRHVVEKPPESTLSAFGPDVRVSMNCWRFTSEIFRACREVPPSPRNELELPLAVEYAINVLGMRFIVILADAPVLDLSRRADIPRVASRLADVNVTF